MCKKIHRGGNAEQYHADKKYKEAVAEAVEACADDIACSLREVNLAECMSLVRETMPIAKQVFGADSDLHLRFVWTYGDCIISDETNLSHDDLLEARVTLEEGFRRSRRVLGPQHPITRNLDGRLARVREKKQIAQH